LITILYLSANPANTEPLELNKECNKIDEELRYAAGKGIFKLEQYHDISLENLIKQILNYEPHIVHFSGHGSPSSSLIFKNEENGQIQVVPPNALSKVFKILSKDIPLVFLNACYSEDQAKAIAEHVDCVIGMSRAISDEAARKFSVSFYSSLGFGKSIRDAFDLATVNLELLEIPEESTPKLLVVKEGVDPLKLFIPEGKQNGNDAICKMLPLFKENLIKLASNEIDVQEFFAVISKSISNFIIDPQSGKFGQIKVNSLSTLYYNLSGKNQDIINKKNMGDDAGALLTTAYAKSVSTDIIKKLDEICNTKPLQ